MSSEKIPATIPKVILTDWPREDKREFTVATGLLVVDPAIENTRAGQHLKNSGGGRWVYGQKCVAYREQ